MLQCQGPHNPMLSEGIVCYLFKKPSSRWGFWKFLAFVDKDIQRIQFDSHGCNSFKDLSTGGFVLIRLPVRSTDYVRVLRTERANRSQARVPYWSIRWLLRRYRVTATPSINRPCLDHRLPTICCIVETNGSSQHCLRTCNLMIARAAPFTSSNPGILNTDVASWTTWLGSIWIIVFISTDNCNLPCWMDWVIRCQRP